MTDSTIKTAALLAAATLAASRAAASPTPTRRRARPSRPGCARYLADGHDQLCLGMYDWPIDLTEAEAGARLAPRRAAAGVREAGPREEHDRVGAQEHREPGRRHQALRAHRRGPQVLQGARLHGPRRRRAPERLLRGAHQPRPRSRAGSSTRTTRSTRRDGELQLPHRARAVAAATPTRAACCRWWPRSIKGADGGLQMHQGFALRRQGLGRRAGPGVTRMARVIRFAPQLGQWLTRQPRPRPGAGGAGRRRCASKAWGSTPPQPSWPRTWRRAGAAWRRRSTASSCRTTSPAAAPVRAPAAGHAPGRGRPRDRRPHAHRRPGLRRARQRAGRRRMPHAHRDGAAAAERRRRWSTR